MKHLKSAMRALASALLLGAFSAAPAMAEPIEVGNENRTLELGVEYLIPAYKASSGIYTATATSRLHMSGAQDFTPYSDPEHTSEIIAESLDNIGMKKYIDVTEGQKVYFYTKFAFNTNTFVLYLDGVSDKPLEVMYQQPTPNERVDFNNYAEMTITFNQNVSLASTDAIISFENRLTGKTESVNSRAMVNQQIVTVNMYRYLYNYIAEGALYPGDVFTVTLQGLGGSNGQPMAGADADGNVTFTFLCGVIPVLATEKYCPDPFLSYWPEGVEEGILTMTFDADLMDDDETYVELGWGNMEGEVGEYYTERVPVKIEGNKLSADFTGKLRTPQTMTPLFASSNYSVMTVKLFNVRDSHGMPVGSEGQGTIGSYSFGPSYKLIERTTLVSEFMPASGALLENVNNVNIWISGREGITYDGFLLTYTDKNNEVATRVLPLSEVSVAYEDANEAEYDFTIPADIKANAKSVTITLNNLVSKDGYDHSNDIRATYSGFVITSSTPANGATMAALEYMQDITIKTNVTDRYPNLYIQYEVIDMDPENENPVVKSYSFMERQADGSFLSTVWENIKLYAGHEYKALFTAWESEEESLGDPDGLKALGSDFVIWNGSTPPYVYSSFTLTELTPSVETLLEPDTKSIVLTFDGPVVLGQWTGAMDDLRTFINTGSGTAMAFADVVALDPQEFEEEFYATKWELILPESYMSSLTAPLAISFTAKDMDAHLLKGNEGEEEYSAFYYEWKVAAMFKDVEVATVREAADAPVSEFKVSQSLGVMPSWMMPESDIKVTVDGREVAYCESIEMPQVEMGETITELTIKLNTTLTADAEYHLILPEGFFVIGEDMRTFTSAAVDYVFEIGEGSGVENAVADETYTVYNAAGILLLNNADAAALRTLTPGLYIINGRKLMVK